MSTDPPTGPNQPNRPAALRRRLSRRSLLAASARAGVGAAGLALVGCSSDDATQPLDQQQTSQLEQQAQTQQTQPSPQQTQPDPQSQSQTAPPDQPSPPNQPGLGGVIQLWLPVDRHDRWDPHRSRYRYTQAMHSLMYNRLLRPASMSTGELEADLAALPEMPDQTTYIFTLDPNAVFWNLPPADGRGVTAEDIRWNIQRQRDALDAAGLSDPRFFRRAAYERTAAVEVDGERAIRLTTAQPDATYLASVHASPFAWITNPEAAELYADDWRDDPADATRNSGSGPYTPRQYSAAELVLARSENWWRPNSAYADGIRLVSSDVNALPDQYAAATIDVAGFPLANEVVERLREQHPQHPAFETPLDVGVELLAPLSADPESPLADPRVVRACAIAIDRAALAQRLYAQHGRPSGPAPWFLDGWSLPSSTLASFPGYRADRDADRADARQLIAAAGGPDALETIPLVVADLFEGFFPAAAEFLREMIADATGLDVEREYRPLAEAVDQLRDGQRFLMLGWGPTPQQADPTDDWAASLHAAGQRHWSDDADPELDALIDQMRSTFERDARQQLARQLQERLLGGESHQWRVALAGGLQLGLHQPWLRPDPRLFAYAWSTDRLSASWIDAALGPYPADRDIPPPVDETQATQEQATQTQETQPTQEAADDG